MKLPSKFLILVVSMILGCAALVSCTLTAIHDRNLSEAKEETKYQNENINELIVDPLSPVAQHQMKFNPYNFVLDDDPTTSALQIYSKEQTEKFAKMRESGERQSLSLDEILFIMSDSARIYYQYDKIVLTNAYEHKIFEPYENCPDSMTITPCHDDISTLSVEEASKKRADAVKDIYKIFFFRCYMYDTWLMKATEACWSASGIYRDNGNFRLDCLEHADYKSKPWGTATTYIKYLNETEFKSYRAYLNLLEVSWERNYNGLKINIEQPLLIFVNYGVRVYYPDGSHAEHYVGDLVSSTPEIDDHMVKNYYKYYYDGYVIVSPDLTNQSSDKYLNSITQYNVFFGLSRPLFSEAKIKQ